MIMKGFHFTVLPMIMHSALLVTPTPDYELVCVAPAQALKCFVKNARTMPYGLLTQMYEALANTINAAMLGPRNVRSQVKI